MMDMKKFLKNVLLKYKAVAMLSLLVILEGAIIVLFGYRISVLQSRNEALKNQTLCENISDKQAIDIVKNLPEVQDYLKEGNKTIEAKDLNENKDGWRVHLYDLLQAKGSDISMTRTFNWYEVNVCTGKITCEFSNAAPRDKSSFPLCED